MQEMIIGIVVRGLVAKGLLFLVSTSVFAWTVTDQEVRLPEEKPVSMSATAAELTHVSVEKIPEAGEISEAEKLGSAKKGDKESGVYFQKNRSSLTLDEQANYDYQYALKQFDKGDTLQAEQLLINTLHKKPEHHTSRVELATLYLKRDNLIEAENVLLEGLRIDENHPDFLKLLAMVHDKKEEPDKALSLLVRVKDSRRHDKNYIAFLGHVYQQTGQYGLARQQYFRLLRAEPQNPLWLLGVSIALDAEGQRDAALEGYQQLSAEGRVDPKILRYVQERIKVLKG